LKRTWIALVTVLGLGMAGGGALLLHQPAPAKAVEAKAPSNLTDFSNWAVLLVAGDYRAHSGAPSKSVRQWPPRLGHRLRQDRLQAHQHGAILRRL
jgi:hypothetical protein